MNACMNKYRYVNYISPSLSFKQKQTLVDNVFTKYT